MALFDTSVWDSCPSVSQLTLTLPDDASPSPAIDPSDPDVTACPPEEPTPIVPKKFDPVFYFDSVFVVFEAENTLFRVPSHIFSNESKTFEKKFNLPTLKNPSGATSTIVLHDVRRDDFCNLLKALYPLALSTKLSLSESEWTSVLKLSTKWCFKNLRKLAISELESLNSHTSINKVILGRLYSISSWLIAGLTEIADRKESMSDDDIVALDYITAIALLKVRELRLQNKCDELERRTNYYYNASLPAFQTTEAISSAFDAELVAVKAEENKYDNVVVTVQQQKIPLKEIPLKGKKKKKGLK